MKTKQFQKLWKFVHTPADPETNIQRELFNLVGWDNEELVIFKQWTSGVRTMERDPLKSEDECYIVRTFCVRCKIRFVFDNAFNVLHDLDLDLSMVGMTIALFCDISSTRRWPFSGTTALGVDSNSLSLCPYVQGVALFQ